MTPNKKKPSRSIIFVYFWTLDTIMLYVEALVAYINTLNHLVLSNNAGLQCGVPSAVAALHRPI